MPEIPLYNGGRSTPSGPIPQMPLDHLGRPRADFSGIIAGLGRVSQGQEALVKASAPPLLDPNMFDGLEKGQQALGNAVADIGSLIEAFAKKRQQVIDQRDSNRATDALTAANREHQATRDASRPETWGTTLSAKLGAVADSLIKDKNLSPEAREIIQGQAQQYVATSVTRAETEGIENLWTQVVDRHLDGIQQNVEAGDADAVMQGATEAVAQGYIDVAMGVNYVRSARSKMHHLQRARDVAERPAQARYWLENPVSDATPEAYSALSPVQVHQLRREVHLSLSTKEQAAMQAGKKALFSGGIKDPADVAYLPALKSLGDPQIVGQVVRRMEALARLPSGNGVDFLRQYVDVTSARQTPLDQQDPQLRWQQLRVLNEAFPEPQTQILHHALESAITGSAPAAEALDYGRRNIVSLMDHGLLDLDPPPPEPAPSALPDLAARPDTPSGTLSPAVAPEDAFSASLQRSARRGFSLIQQLEQLQQHAAASARHLTKSDVDSWINENTLAEQRYGGVMILQSALQNVVKQEV